MSSPVNHQLQTDTTTSSAPSIEFFLQVDVLYRLVEKFRTSIRSTLGATLSLDEVWQFIDSFKKLVSVPLSDLDQIYTEQQQQQTISNDMASDDDDHRSGPSPNPKVYRCIRRGCNFVTTNPTGLEQHFHVNDQPGHLVKINGDADGGERQDDSAHLLEPAISDDLSANPGVSNPGNSVRAEDIQSTPKVRKGRKGRKRGGCGGQGGAGAGGNGSSGSGANATPRIEDVSDHDLELVNQNRDEAHDDAQEAEDQIVPDVVAQPTTPPNQQNHEQNLNDQEGSDHDGANDDQDDQEGSDRDGANDDQDDQEGSDRDGANDDQDDQEAEDQVDRNAAPQPATPKPYNLRKSTLTGTPSKSYNYYVELGRKMPIQTSKSSVTERFVLNRANIPTTKWIPILETIEKYDPRIKEHLQSNQNQQIDQVTVQCKQTR